MNTVPQKRPVLFSLVSFLLAIPLSWLFMTPIARLVPFYFGETVKYGLTALVVFGVCQETWGKLPFSLENRHLAKGLFSAGLAGLICALCALLFRFQPPRQVPGPEILAGFPAYTAMGAFSEELLFRGLILTVLVKAWKEQENGTWKAVLVSSAFFSLRYLLNLIFEPGTPVTTLGEAVCAFCTGIYLCAVCLRTGNLWVCILLHFLEYFCTGLWPLFSGEPAADGTIPGTLLLTAMHLIYVLAAWLLLRRLPHPDTPEQTA